MTPEEIKRAIAESLGYHDLHTSPQGHLYGKSPEDTTIRFRLPDYHSDLNAMHEAEKVLSVRQCVKYRLRLSANSDGPKAQFRTVEAAMCHATAPQRAEAFLRTLGKWKD